MKTIDAHIHYGDDDPDLLALIAELDLKFLNICVAQDTDGQWREQARRYADLAKRIPTRFAWCTSFDLPDMDRDFDAIVYAQRAIESIDKDFEAGAIACKIWKNFGMEVKDQTGEFIMPDDAILDPIYDHLASKRRPLLAHIAEPLACWLPLDEASPHYGYYSQNPEWHMFNKPDFPSHTQLIAARDNVLAKHPTLRFIGAHLGSLEYDVDEVAARLERYPNFAVDISARLGDLVVQDSAKVRRFFLDYPDRILFGTDVVMRQPPSAMSATAKANAIRSLRDIYATHFAYFESDGMVKVRGRNVQGLGLPKEVLEQFYRGNAEEWYG